MFGWLKKKSEIERLKDKYAQMMKEAYHLSHTNRRESDAKVLEAEALLKTIELMEKTQSSV
jgi:Family of unknown function (DUF6435)